VTLAVQVIGDIRTATDAGPVGPIFVLIATAATLVAGWAIVATSLRSRDDN